jgi:hypothetical protein
MINLADNVSITRKPYKKIEEDDFNKTYIYRNPFGNEADKFSPLKGIPNIEHNTYPLLII